VVSDQVLKVETVADESSIPLATLVEDSDVNRELYWRRRRHWTMLWIATAVVILSFLLQVRSEKQVAFVGLQDYPLPPTCMSESLFGVRCPGCGLTRSFVYFAHGQWRESLAMHRLGWLMVVAVLLQFPYRLLGLRHPEGMPLKEEIPVWFGRFLIFALIANWLFDMLGPGPYC
jgi:hypothetical protein